MLRETDLKNLEILRLDINNYIDELKRKHVKLSDINNGGTYKACELYVYDEYGKLIEKVDREGNVFVHEYDDKGNLIKTNGEQINAYDYDEHGNIIRHAYNGGRLIDEYDLTYDDNGKLKSSKKSSGLVFNYDEYGNEIIQGETNTYDDNGNIVRVDYEKNNVIKYTINEYHENGNLSKSIGYNKLDEIVTESLYDYYGFRIYDGVDVEYVNTFNGGFVRKVYPDGKVVSEVKDEKGNVITENLSSGKCIRYYYDDNDSLYKMMMPNGLEIEQHKRNRFHNIKTNKEGQLELLSPKGMVIVRCP